MKNTVLSLETAKLMYNSSDSAIKQFALDNYPELGVKSLPKTWEQLNTIKGYYIDETCVIMPATSCPTRCAKDIFVTQEQAQASIALAQLSQLKKVYNNGWEPNWKDNLDKYTIQFKESILISDRWIKYQCFLAFQTQKIRDEFLLNFKDLIEQAKPLL